MILLGYTVRSRKTTRHHPLWCYSALGPHRVKQRSGALADECPLL